MSTPTFADDHLTSFSSSSARSRITHTRSLIHSTFKSNAMAGQEDDSRARREQARAQFNLLFIVLQIIGLLMILSVLFWIMNYLGGFGWSDTLVRFNFHPICMILGMVYQAGNSILAFRFLRDQPKPMVKLIHGGLHVSAFVISLFGSIAVFTFHLDQGIPNLYSLHSWLGATTMTLFFVQYFGAFYNFLYPGTSGQFRAWLLPYHVLGGFSIFLLAIGRKNISKIDLPFHKLINIFQTNNFHCAASCLSGLTEKAFLWVCNFLLSRIPSNLPLLTHLQSEITHVLVVYGSNFLGQFYRYSDGFVRFPGLVSCNRTWFSSSFRTRTTSTDQPHAWQFNATGQFGWFSPVILRKKHLSLSPVSKWKGSFCYKHLWLFFNLDLTKHVDSRLVTPFLCINLASVKHSQHGEEYSSTLFSINTRSLEFDINFGCVIIGRLQSFF